MKWEKENRESVQRLFDLCVCTFIKRNTISI